MVEKKKPEAEAIEFPLNQRLLTESAKIKEERKVIKGRIDKIEAARGQVSDSVYQRVKSDYVDQLNDNTNQLLEKKQDIDRELATLYEAKKKVEINVATHSEQLEEIKFRHNLGEHNDEKFHKLADEENEKLGKFEKILAAVESNIKQYESLFEGEGELGAEPKEAPEPLPPPPPPPAEPEKEAPLSAEEEYQVGGEEGYFGHVTEDVPAEKAREITSKDIIAPPEAPAAAKLTIVEGDGKGEVYNIIEEIAIGRASSNDIVLKEAKVSRQHASVKKQGKEYLIEDLHSSNGVFVNDEKVKEHALNDGDLVRIGDFILQFTC